MSDLEEDAPPQQPVGNPSPALQEFQSVFTHPDAQDWAGEVSTRLNDYFQRRQIVDNNIKAGENFVNDIDQFKSGLISGVTADPHFVHTALDIVPLTMRGIIDTMPNPPEDAYAHYATLTGHIQSEIAAAAVTSAAETHEGTARAILANPRIQDALGDGVGPLDTYISMQARARYVDAKAAEGQAADALVERADQSARNYIGALVGSNGVQSPEGWAQAVMADNKVPPQLKVDLFDVHNRLGAVGDAQTDPHTVMDMVNRMANGRATQRDLYPLIGENLSLTDAGMLAAGMKNPKFLQALDVTLQAAGRQIAPHGDIAETRALGRFINYLLPEIYAGKSLDPANENYFIPKDSNDRFWSSFRPNGEDLVIGERDRLDLGRTEHDVGTNDRPELGAIFGGNARMPSMRMPYAKNGPYPGGSPENPDLMNHYGTKPVEPHYRNPALRSEMKPLPMTPQVANPLAPPLTGQAPIGGTESGSFFSRKAREMQQSGTKLNG